MMLVFYAIDGTGLALLSSEANCCVLSLSSLNTKYHHCWGVELL